VRVRARSGSGSTIYPGPLHRVPLYRPTLRRSKLTLTLTQVTFFVSFSTGLLSTAVTVLGAALAGFTTTARSYAIAIAVITAVALAYIWQAYRLISFFR